MRHHYALVPTKNILVVGYVDGDPPRSTVSAAYLNGDSDPVWLDQEYKRAAEAAVLDEHLRVSNGGARSCWLYTGSKLQVVKSGVLEISPNPLVVTGVSPGVVRCYRIVEDDTLSFGHKFIRNHCRLLPKEASLNRTDISKMLDSAHRYLDAILRSQETDSLTEADNAVNSYLSWLEQSGWTEEEFEQALSAHLC